MSNSLIDISDVFEFSNDQAMRVREASLVALQLRPVFVPGAPNSSEYVAQASSLIDHIYQQASVFFSQTLLQEDQWGANLKKVAINAAVGDAVAAVRACCEPFPDFPRLQGVYYGRLGRLNAFHEMGFEYADQAFLLTSKILQSLYAHHHTKMMDFDFELEMQTMIALHVDELVEQGHAPERVLKAWESNVSLLEKTIALIPPAQGALIKNQMNFSSMKDFVNQFVQNVEVLERRMFGDQPSPSSAPSVG